MFNFLQQILFEPPIVVTESDVIRLEYNNHGYITGVTVNGKLIIHREIK